METPISSEGGGVAKGSLEGTSSYLNDEQQDKLGSNKPKKLISDINPEITKIEYINPGSYIDVLSK